MRKAKTILLFLCAFAMLTAAAAACVLFQRNRAADTVRFVVQAGDVREKVSLYDNSGTYYAFLPAYADFGSMQIEYEAGCVVYLDGKAYTNGMTCGELLPDRPYNVTITDAFGTAVSNRKLVVKKAANIPAMALHLSNGTLESLHANKEVSKTGTVSVIGADQSVLYAGPSKAYTEEEIPPGPRQKNPMPWNLRRIQSFWAWAPGKTGCCWQTLWMNRACGISWCTIPPKAWG